MKTLYTIAVLVTVLFATSPFFIYAKEKDNLNENSWNKNKNAMEKSIEKQKKLLENIKKSYENDEDEDDDKDDNKTSTSSMSSKTKSPKFSNSVAIVGTSTINMIWKTNIPTNSQIYYSTSSPVITNASTTKSLSDPTLVTNHSLLVKGLVPGSTYYVVVKSANAMNKSSSIEFSFDLPTL